MYSAPFRPGLDLRIVGRVFTLIRRPSDLYVVGFLFGLGFDTATEIGLLTGAAVAATQAQPLTAVLGLPLVFAAGMSLMDTADGVIAVWKLGRFERRC